MIFDTYLDPGTDTKTSQGCHEIVIVYSRYSDYVQSFPSATWNYLEHLNL